MWPQHVSISAAALNHSRWGKTLPQLQHLQIATTATTGDNCVLLTFLALAPFPLQLLHNNSNS